MATDYFTTAAGLSPPVLIVKQDKSREVPVHLLNSETKFMKELGYGHEYRYAHDEPDVYAAWETYLPDGIGESIGTNLCLEA